MTDPDLDLLKQYEPVLRFAKSERFFPMDAERYLEKCQIFPSGPQGVVDLVTHLNDAVQKRIGRLQSEQFYLRFVNDPLSDADAWIWWAILTALGTVLAWVLLGVAGLEIIAVASASAALVIFMLASPMRLRIIPAILAVLLFSALEILPIWFFLKPHSYLSRQVEYRVLLPVYIVVLFYLSVRTMKFILDRIIPELPGLLMDLLSQATEKVAERAYRLYAEILAQDSRPVYHGRVVHESDANGTPWTVLQYHFFYAFNDWRMAAHGMNHHEGDWEMLAVYLRRGRPYGVIFAHHYSACLKRWTEARKVVSASGEETTHPIAYVGLGSHALYPQPEVIRSPSLYPRGRVQRFAYWLDGLIHFIFLLFNPSQKARQLALQQIHSTPGGLLNEASLANLRDEEDHYLVSLPFEIASGDGFRAGSRGDTLREGVVKSSSYLKRRVSDRPVTRPQDSEWRVVDLNNEPEWVQYKGLWGVKSLLDNESGPAGPKWERPLKNQPPEVRLRWERPLDWLKLVEAASATE